MKTRRLSLLVISLSLTVLAVALLSLAGPARAQDPAGELLALINTARLAQGLHPYTASVELNAAAQRHSDDMAETGQIGHTGSDGSSSTQRILDAGYGAYEFGLVASENVYGGTGGAEAPFNNWMSDTSARSNMLHEEYREVGIGVAGDGVGRTFWTLAVGARPNVLPVLINGGATSVETITVTLRLFPENVVPEGRGTAIGQPAEYRASTNSRFPAAAWAPWAAQVSFVLDETPGPQTVYVQLRDSAGRTIISQASVTLIGPEMTTTPTPTLTTATATATATRTPPSSPTSTATATPAPSASPTITPSASATPTASSAATPTSAPTSPPQPTAAATSLPLETAFASPTSRSPEPTAELSTVAPPLPTDYYAEEKTAPRPLEERLAPWAVGLQIVALALGVYIALRRNHASSSE
jgi:uncharacterized protein YkwD